MLEYLGRIKFDGGGPLFTNYNSVIVFLSCVQVTSITGAGEDQAIATKILPSRVLLLVLLTLDVRYVESEMKLTLQICCCSCFSQCHHSHNNQTY